MNHFQNYLAEEFVEDYQEGRLSRREALRLLASVTGSLALANSFLAACAPAAQSTPTSAPTTPPTDAPTLSATDTPGAQPTATAELDTPAPASPTAAPVGTVSADDPSIEAGPIEFPGQDATLMGYLARPVGDGPFATVLVCHENRGLTPHIEDVARRAAKAGYVGLAVDLLSRQGGTASVGADSVPGQLGNMSPDQFIQDFTSGWQYLQSQSFVRADRVGMVGFCFGGGVTWTVATGLPELRAAVPFYGPPPPLEDIPNINAAVLAIYAGNDQRINQSIPSVEAAMQSAGKIYEKMIYPDTDHAFHNDTGQRYNQQAAQDAWVRTLAWFGQYLAG